MHAIVVNTGGLSFEQGVSICWHFFRDCLPSSASNPARFSRWRRVTCAEAPTRARGRRDPEAEAISRGKKKNDVQSTFFSFLPPIYYPRTTLALLPSSNLDPGSRSGPSSPLPTTVRAFILTAFCSLVDSRRIAIHGGQEQISA